MSSLNSNIVYQFFCPLIILSLVFVSCKEERKSKNSQEVNVVLDSRSNSETTGEVFLIQKEEVVTLEATIKGLTPGGTHAIHIHEYSDCSADDGTSTGGHWNPTFENHGKWGSPEGFHRGDIGNFQADESGIGTITFSTNLWCIGCEDETKNVLNKSIIVHQDPDDYISQPTGAAGSRISCGGIIK
ncbi:MAG: superoxide dismutase family protein [Flavobacteriaceae bacterium]|nr:superoxide dismutase family protein [Flavobacteriaceae bacterium]